MSKTLKKQVPWWITYPVLVIFAFTIVGSATFFYYVHSADAFGIFQPFGGRLIYSDFSTCSCGFIILNIYDYRTRTTIRVVYPYVLQLLKTLLALIGIDIKIPVPMLYMYYNIFTPGVNVLGNYFPWPGAPCLTIIPSPPFCAPTSSGGWGYLFRMGTSLVPGF